MATEQREKIDYEFEDLRRNSDPIPGNVMDQLGLEDEDLDESERHDDKSGNEADEELDDKDGELEPDDKDGEEEEEQYDPVKMSRSMRKRLVDVQRKANRAIASAKKEAGATISKLEKRIVDLERSGKTDELESEFSAKIEAIEAGIEAAMEKGDSKEVIRLTRELSEITADKRVKQSELAQHEEPDDLESQQDELIPRAQEWLDEQEDWWDDPEYGHIRAYVRKADMALQKKGYLPADDDFYEQLEGLVEKKYPGVIELTMKDEELEAEEEEEEDLDLEDEFEDIPSKASRRRAAKKAKKRGRRRSPVSEGDRGGVSRSKKRISRKKGKTLSKARIKNMRMFGMDPENPEHVESYMEGI